ncbi:hypothetical protein HW115_16230 [Verrucomicrobiaceae bacterium N1E253]|uniref:SLA1 homology domain-containing protein n=1 Tax=Oceaniferula marina TaxID=2748318 RepID=A0A851GMV8_9BACT|nr:SHD1 domain-containing protein [Oceaniferula marina]NWK57171.1 hypothetical protein [Oceaniferula marina]
MMKNKRIVCCGAAWLVACAIPAMGRTFTDVQGRKIEANIVQVMEGKVELKLQKNGKTYQVPFEKLSKEDVDYIKEWQEKKQEEAEEKPKENESSGDTKRVSRGGFSAAALKKQYGLKDNFDAEWPDRIDSGFDVEIAIVKEDDTNNEYVYHSPNYEFVSDVRLNKSVVKKFAAMFEATREYCRELPIASMKAHIPGAQFRHKILLFETRDSYISNGGPPSSAGVFMSRGGKGVVMAPLEGLGVKKVGSGYMYDHKGSNKTLPHELAHQLTDNAYFESGARGWFSEGLAEYVAVTPYRSGKFMVKTNLSAIKDYVMEYGKGGVGGRNLGDEIALPPLKRYMLQPYSSFTANGNLNYGVGLLLTYYYFHWDGNKDRANINAFLKALKEGKSGEDALNVLLAGRSWEEMQDAISKAWRSRGIKITFR